MGALCSIGNSADEIWASAACGKSGIGAITRFDATGYETTIAGEIKGFDAAEVVGRKEARRMDRFAQLAVAASFEARNQAGLQDAGVDPTRIGALIGTGMGGIEMFEQGMDALQSGGPRRVSPFVIPAMLGNMASGNVSIAVGAKSSNFAPVSACAAAGHAIGEAMRLIQRGDADVVYAGGSDAPVTRMGIAGFGAMGALSRRNDDPEAASRPFDGGRDGFVLAEGAGVLVLEEREHALARGATILAEIIGYGSTDDANHIVQPGPGGEGAARAIGLALKEAEISGEHIGYINAHGTSTPLNEKLETEAIKRAFGDIAYQIPISSTKSMTGHTLGAAGAIEAIITIQAMRNELLPPTINQEIPDPDCDLDYIPNSARPKTFDISLSNSMGFGGHNVALLFQKA